MLNIDVIRFIRGHKKHELSLQACGRVIPWLAIIQAWRCGENSYANSTDNEGQLHNLRRHRPPFRSSPQNGMPEFKLFSLSGGTTPLLLTPMGFPSNWSMMPPRTSSMHLSNSGLSTLPTASSSIILNDSLTTLSIYATIAEVRNTHKYFVTSRHSRRERHKNHASSVISSSEIEQRTSRNNGGSSICSQIVTWSVDSNIAYNGQIQNFKGEQSELLPQALLLQGVNLHVAPMCPIQHGGSSSVQNHCSSWAWSPTLTPKPIEKSLR